MHVLGVKVAEPRPGLLRLTAATGRMDTARKILDKLHADAWRADVDVSRGRMSNGTEYLVFHASGWRIELRERP